MQRRTGRAHGLPTATAASPPAMAASARARSRPPIAPERKTTGTPSGSSQLRKLAQCCSASSSVGAISATWRPLATATTAAIAATTVFPDPTSPCTIRCIGRARARSARTSPDTRHWAGVRSKGSDSTKLRASSSPRSRTGARRQSSRRLATPQRQVVREKLLEREPQTGPRGRGAAGLRCSFRPAACACAESERGSRWTAPTAPGRPVSDVERIGNRCAPRQRRGWAEVPAPVAPKPRG